MLESATEMAMFFPAYLVLGVVFVRYDHAESWMCPGLGPAWALIYRLPLGGMQGHRHGGCAGLRSRGHAMGCGGCRTQAVRHWKYTGKILINMTEMTNKFILKCKQSFSVICST